MTIFLKSARTGRRVRWFEPGEPVFVQYRDGPLSRTVTGTFVSGGKELAEIRDRIGGDAVVALNIMVGTGFTPPFGQPHILTAPRRGPKLHVAEWWEDVYREGEPSPSGEPVSPWDQFDTIIEPTRRRNAMDNRLFDINGQGRQQLGMALLLACLQESGRGRPVVAYSIHPKLGMILYWTDEKDAIKFPAPLSAERAADLVWDWLGTSPAVELTDRWDKEYPDGEVWNTPAWRMSCGEWGHVDGKHSGIVSIRPVWAWAGK